MTLCIECLGPTTVTDSRPMKKLNGVKRRRACLTCKCRFTTYEFAGDVIRENATLAGAINHIQKALNSLTQQVIKSRDIEKWGELGDNNS